MKGNIKINKTYDTLKARRIGQEHYIMGAIRQNSINKPYKVFSSNTNKPNQPPHITSSHTLIPIHIPDLRSKAIDINCLSLTPDGLFVTYLMPLWSKYQHKLSFLPTILRLAVTTECHLIVLFDHQDDWPYLPHVDDIRLTVGDVTLDVVLDSEEKDETNNTVLSWLRTNDGSHPFRFVSEAIREEPTVGYKIALLRSSGWARGGLVPEQKVWRGFWHLYRKACVKIESIHDINISPT
eukprot:CAMPEP_0182435348 /NCGR_PEP_ID=MMETSP1167-20130531/75262_1 /TAXON_ID=2988 /ORGANISM="Mallomonas Sp, Strain CCMP3275" /LENGTH=237 /DNA_ID=CAMNT_0024626325 /DNA_START=397 /DNA_END=1106 /DNA_ORIENTATION=+